MRTWIIIDSEGKQIDRINGSDTETPEGYDSSTWILVDDEHTHDASLTYVDGSWVDQRDWSEARRNAYPPIGDQLGDLFDQGAFSTAMSDKIQAIKDAYPKPSE